MMGKRHERSLEEHLFGVGPKRILSLDGGGVRGLITLGMLKRVETILAARSPSPENFRLCDYFDLIGGTSTGGIIATLLALGKSVNEILYMYDDMCPRIFGERKFLSRFYIGAKFDAAAFREVIDETFDQIAVDNGLQHLIKGNGGDGSFPSMGTDLLRTGLAVFTKRIDTSSLWVFTNNPRSKYWDPQSVHWGHEFIDKGEIFRPNRDYSLRAIVQATASAPSYLDPVDVEIAPGVSGLFLDGGVSPSNNPSLDLFYMTTLKSYHEGSSRAGPSPFGFGWKTGGDKLFLLSVGTGTWRDKKSLQTLQSQSVILGAISALTSIIKDCEYSAVAMLQAISETPGLACHINGEVGDLRDMRLVPEPLLTFKRAAPELDQKWMRENLGNEFDLGAAHLLGLRHFDNATFKNRELLYRIGVASGERLFEEIDFPPAFDV